jgi:hypothetical protein
MLPVKSHTSACACHVSTVRLKPSVNIPAKMFSEIKTLPLPKIRKIKISYKNYNLRVVLYVYTAWSLVGVKDMTY